MKRYECVSGLLAVLMATGFLGCAAMQEKTGDFKKSEVMFSEGGVPFISRKALRARLDDPSLAILDVRKMADWTDSNAKIKGAVRENHWEVEKWASKYPQDQIIITYCA